ARRRVPACGRSPEVLLDREQRVDEALALRGADPGERVAAQLRRDLAHRAQRGLDLFGEVHSPYAAVRSVMFAPHPALGLQPVEQPAERRLLDLQRLRQLGLGDAVAAVQVSKNPPLSARQAEL